MNLCKLRVFVLYNLVKSFEQENYGETLYDSNFGKLSCEEWAKANGYELA